MKTKKKIWQNEYVRSIVILILSSLITLGVTQYRKHERDIKDKEDARMLDSLQTAKINRLYDLIGKKASKDDMDQKLDKAVFEQYERDIKR